VLGLTSSGTVRLLDRALKVVAGGAPDAGGAHGKVLIGLVREPGAVRWMCRLRDTHQQRQTGIGDRS
jgi:hypothetical protein